MPRHQVKLCIALSGLREIVRPETQGGALGWYGAATLGLVFYRRYLFLVMNEYKNMLNEITDVISTIDKS